LAKVGPHPFSTPNWALFVVKLKECPEFSKIGLWSLFVANPGPERLHEESWRHYLHNSEQIQEWRRIGRVF